MGRRNIAHEIEADFEEVLELNSHQQTINALREELATAKQEAQLYQEEALKNVRKSLEASGGKYKIAIKDIQPSQQCRQTFTTSAIVKRAESLKEEGQLDPIILVPLALETNKYQLEDGELRWRAANYLVEQGYSEWKYLDAVIAPISPNEQEIHWRSLIHHLHSEELNPLDRLEAITREIYWQINLEVEPEAVAKHNGDKLAASQDKFRKALRNMHYFFKTNGKAKLKLQQLQQKAASSVQQELASFELSQLQKELLQLLLKLQINLQSFVANDLPMGSLSDDLKQGIRTQGLGCHQALAINKLSAKNLNKVETEVIKIRAEVIKQVIEQHLSVRKTRFTVNQVLEKYGDQINEKQQKSVTKYINYIEGMNLGGLSQEEKAALVKTLEIQLAKLRSSTATH